MLRLQAVVAPNMSTSVLPQLVAQSALLELSALDFEERVRRELDVNPALELRKDTPIQDAYIPSFERGGSSPRSDAADGYDTWAALAGPVSLKDDLKQQYRTQYPADDRHIAEYIMEALDDDGYLTLPIPEIAHHLRIDTDRAEKALSRVQGLLPRGVGARDLSECLRLQLQDFDPRDIPAGIEVFLDNLELVGGARDVLKQATGLSSAAIDTVMAFIRDELCPYPGRSFQIEVSTKEQTGQYAYPDVVLSLDTAGKIVISIPQSDRLALRINSAYRRLDDAMRQRNERSHDETLQDARRMVREARQFIDNISRRYATMQKVMAAIAEAQEAFITGGPAHLKPLNKKEIAETVGMHEATVCRATRGKFMLMPDGRLEPIDILFDDALPAKNMINRLVNSEDKRRPLSDRKLQHELAGHGFDIARRTVTKYRLQLDIPPASRRRAA